MNTQLNPESNQEAELCSEAPPEYASMTDLQLIESCQQRDKRAFQHLYARNKRSVLGLLYRLAPEHRDHSDLVQDVFIRMWSSIGCLRNPVAFKRWMNQITTRVFYDELRRRHPRTISIDSPRYENDEDTVALMQIPDNSPSPDQLVELRELRMMIDRALVTLPRQFHRAFILREIEGLSYQEIGNATDSPVGTIKSQIARARGKMQSHLSPYLTGSDSDDRRMRISA